MKLTSPEALAHALKNARKRQGLSQSETASQIGVKQATVSGFENHPAGSRIETLFKLLSALNLELQVSERDTPDDENGWDQEW